MYKDYDAAFKYLLKASPEGMEALHSKDYPVGEELGE